MQRETHLELMIDLSLKAGAAIDAIYQTDFDTDAKGDGSPVTAADKDAEAIIEAGLKAAQPAIPILAEEAASEGHIPELGDRFFLVDPLDGTREFVSRNGEFTVNIALIDHGRPIAGVVYAPAINKLYYGAIGEGAFYQEIAPGQDRSTAEHPHEIEARSSFHKNLIAVASRSHRSPETEALLDKIGVKDFTPAGSSLKFCLLAQGSADVYPRLGRTMEWDTGAGQAVLVAAGGRVDILEGENEAGPLTYNKRERGFDNPHFIAWGR
ncbi:3'(2'),5'-bisphosphate nucleotidase CysQ [Parasphingopyxis sp. CP4]|uniref:3'(2'),5'-bisphosphate nucleotidase CysQ n=1 Tax=Parasphingopyxis sp. CP4 TaxID=2724527 RepID=UPI0015A3CB12|nr:3'(2'),5'-bisphosphate nucleotidase CysQ [Parasphingopyxis sp. CP4]QLC21856.1 3'(2'),5'-bisphosphate nucleotidase CysQ [Parasphingopyxis sp. CP4]